MPGEIPELLQADNLLVAYTKKSVAWGMQNLVSGARIRHLKQGAEAPCQMSDDCGGKEVSVGK